MQKYDERNISRNKEVEEKLNRTLSKEEEGIANGCRKKMQQKVNNKQEVTKRITDSELEQWFCKKTFL